MKGEHLGEFEEWVLLALRHRGGGAGVVDVQELLESMAGRRASMGSIYSSLDRLHRKGFVTSTLGDPENRKGGKRRRLYSLTPAAEARLAHLRDTRERLWRTV